MICFIILYHLYITFHTHLLTLPSLCQGGSMQPIENSSLLSQSATASAYPIRRTLGAHDLSALEHPSPISKPERTLGYLFRQFFTPAPLADTGLEGLSLRNFVEVARAKRAFFHATETELRAGWWSSLLSTRFLNSDASLAFRNYLSRHIRNNAVVEIGPGEQIKRHTQLMRSTFGASRYLSVDLNSESAKYGARHMDALSFFSLIDDSSVSAIMAFGVFNEPMSLQYPADSPPHFYLPARGPEDATRAHCEHEYVRRLAREMLRVLKPGGVLLGDGLHSRGFEAEVRNYILSAGFTPDLEGFLTLESAFGHDFIIRDPFFFTRKEG